MSQSNNTTWKEIAGLEGRYMVSSKGEIKNIKNGRIRKCSLDRKGYQIFCYYDNGKNHYLKVHRIVAIHFLDNPLGLPQVNHKDGNKINNRVANLEWCTQAENNLHALSKGLRRLPSGENHWQSKLTDQQIIEIRSKYIPRKYSQKKIAEEYGVSQSLIWLIVKGDTHPHLNLEVRKFDGGSYNRSGYRGVRWEYSANKWGAYIYINRKPVYLGTSTNPRELAHIYNQFAEQLFGDKAKLNEI